MNTAAAYNLFQEQLFIDITLTLCDGINELCMSLHKTILYMSSEYFKKLLTSFKERTLNDITITVPNAYAAYDCIMSFYGQVTNSGNFSKWNHALELYRCKNYFCLENDPEMLYGLNVPIDGFDLLLDVTESIYPNKSRMRIIENNLSSECDLSKLSKELLKELLVIKKMYTVLVNGEFDCCLMKWNPTIADSSVASSFFEYIGDVCYSTDNKFVAIIYPIFNEVHGALILDAGTKKIICKFAEQGDSITRICYSPNNKYFALCNSSGQIKIYAANTNKLIHSWTTGRVFALVYSPDSKYIVSGHKDGICVHCAETAELIYNFAEVYIDTRVRTPGVKCSSEYSSDTKRVICFSPDSKQIAYVPFDSKGYCNRIEICDFHTRILLRTLTGHKDSVTTMCYSPTGAYLVSGSRDRTIKIWNGYNGELIHSFFAHYEQVLDLCFSPTGSEIISCGSDGVKIWDLSTYKLLHALNDFGKITGICCSNVDNDMIEKIIKLINTD
jgi:WD40 repeat protein